MTLLTATWLVAASPAWAAQEPQPQMGATNKSYVLPYIMVILVTALGMLVVLRPSARKGSSRPKPTES
jgi:heme/copper-type cytochrome/quinol oxidase subunit 2